MEDDEESGRSSTLNGRIAVTVAAPSPQLINNNNNNSLTLALPIQQQQTKTPGSTGGREDCWSEGATAVLIDAWGERYLELSRGNLRQKHWKEVADIVSSRDDYTKTPKTDIQCKNRIDTVKKKYKVEKAKIGSGSGPSHWRFFHRLDHLIGPCSSSSSASKLNPSTPTTSTTTPPPAALFLADSSANNNSRVPMGIPVGFRSASLNNNNHHQDRSFPNLRITRRPPPPVDSDDDDHEPHHSADSSDGLPPASYSRKRPRRIPNPMLNNKNINANVSASASASVRMMMTNNKKSDGFGGGSGIANKSDRNQGNSMRELTRAIMKFGQVYEQAETAKLQQMVDMEKQRMKFAKEMELQRMQFFMKTQLELSQLNHNRRPSPTNNNNNNHHGGINDNNDEANNTSNINNNNNNNSDSSN